MGYSSDNIDVKFWRQENRGRIQSPLSVEVIQDDMSKMNEVSSPEWQVHSNRKTLRGTWFEGKKIMTLFYMYEHLKCGYTLWCAMWWKICNGELSLKNRRNMEIRLAIESKYIALFNQRSGYSSLFIFFIFIDLLSIIMIFLNYWI